LPKVIVGWSRLPVCNDCTACAHIDSPTPARYRSAFTQRVLQGRSSKELIGKPVRLGSWTLAIPALPPQR
jgi:hypothetical protein